MARKKQLSSNTSQRAVEWLSSAETLNHPGPIATLSKPPSVSARCVPHRRLVGCLRSARCLKKLFDLGPTVIGLQSMWVARTTELLARRDLYRGVASSCHCWVLSFLIWSAESLFEYLYGLLCATRQTVQHRAALEAYDHPTSALEMGSSGRQQAGRLLAHPRMTHANRWSGFSTTAPTKLLASLLPLCWGRHGDGPCCSPGVPGRLSASRDSLRGSVIFPETLSPPSYRDVAQESQVTKQQPGQTNLGGMADESRGYAAEAGKLRRIVFSELPAQQPRASSSRRLHSPDPFRDSVRLSWRSWLSAAARPGEERLPIAATSLSVFITHGCSGRAHHPGRTLERLQRAMASSDRARLARHQWRSTVIDPCHCRSQRSGIPPGSFGYGGRARID